MRQITNEILADALFYFTSFHGQNVINIVAKLLDEKHAEFMQENPDFNGKIAFMGHSLG
jgi:DDHD domain